LCELVGAGYLGALTPTQWSFMGHITGRLLGRRLEAETIPEPQAKLSHERPDFAF
jgi:hypothetical protein